MQDQEGPGDNVVRDGAGRRNRILLGTPQRAEQWWRPTPAAAGGTTRDTSVKTKVGKETRERKELKKDTNTTSVSLLFFQGAVTSTKISYGFFTQHGAPGTHNPEMKRPRLYC